jgi:hypothetical protein
MDCFVGFASSHDGAVGAVPATFTVIASGAGRGDPG